LKTVNAGNPGTGFITYDLNNNGVGYSTSGGFLDSINSQIQGYADKIKSGQIKVPTTP
jgi:basic membrane protein A